ncbi:MAG: SDR family oxidoreductase [Anaerolineae bacterium]|nr:SDR family oxidoreductase [Anaerolineae bacterium]
MLVENRVALITGSTSGGMGRSIALTLARNGADVVLNYGTHRQDAQADAEAQAVKQAIENFGRRALLIKADTTQAKAVETMVQTVLDTFGKVDILVNNAGGGWNPADITELSPEQFHAVLQAEIEGAFYAIRACLPVMRQNRWGRIINLGAYNAGTWAAEHGEPVEYALGKGGRTLLTRHLAQRERAHNITTNQINPGPGHTAHFTSLDEAVAYSQHNAQWANRQRCTPQDIADAVLFLCTEEARFISGAHLNFVIQ